MVSQADLDHFYETLVVSVRSAGGACAITSGMACVHYGIAFSTKDCDLLCLADGASRLLEILARTEFQGVRCRYRGNISPPLDARWLRGGWTSHFRWPFDKAEPHLDVFGIAPRGTTRWERETQGLYAHPHTVAEMKRTDRTKDWPFATALGTRMLNEGDARGWLHLFADDILMEMVSKRPCPDEIRCRRPVLELAFSNDSRLRSAVMAEIHYWHELDRIRLRVHEQAVRPYLSAVRREQLREEADLMVQHAVRLKCAEELLVINPVAAYGIDRLIQEAREEVRQYSGDTWLPWLPDVHENFDELAS